MRAHKQHVPSIALVLFVLPTAWAVYTYPSDMKGMELLKEWWNDARNDRFAHRANYFTYSRGSPAKINATHVERRIANMKKNWMRAFDFKGKAVVDYGVGSGHLGLALLRDLHVSRYIAVDISNVSLGATRATLANAGIDMNRVETHLIPVEFASLNADLFCSLAVIQHFPADYVIPFFPIWIALALESCTYNFVRQRPRAFPKRTTIPLQLMLHDFLAHVCSSSYRDTARLSVQRLSRKLLTSQFCFT